MRIYASREDRLLQAGLAREALRATRAAEAGDPSLRRLAREREILALQGVAMAFGDTRSRAWIHDVARRAARRALWHSRRIALGHWEGLEVAGREHLDGALGDGRSAIVAPVHTGPFHSIAPALHGLGFRVAWVLDAPNVSGLSSELQGKMAVHFARMERERASQARGESAAAGDEAAAGAHAFAGGILPLSADSPATLWSLCRALAEGRLGLLFPDGNTGLAGHRIDASCVHVSFFGRAIAVRAGVAAASAIAGAPIVPAVVRERPRRPPLLTFSSPIRRGLSEPKADYRARAMRALFAHVEAEVAAAPARWEEWPHLRRWILPEPAPGPASPSAPAIDLGAAARAGARLVPSSARVWVIPVQGRPTAVDVDRGAELGDDPVLLRAIEAAEHRAALAEFLFLNGPTAPRHLRTLLDARAIELRVG